MKAAAFRSGHAIHWRRAVLCFGFWLVTMASPQAGCFAGGSDRLIVELLFGRNIENRGTVSNQAFQGFLDSEVTPRFPGGFTVLDTQGQYRATGSRIIVKEAGKYLLIAVDDETSAMPRIWQIIKAYKRRFRQKSVGLITRRGCVSF